MVITTPTMILEASWLNKTAIVRITSPEPIIAGMSDSAVTPPAPKYQSAPALNRKEPTNAKTTTRSWRSALIDHRRLKGALDH